MFFEGHQEQDVNQPNPGGYSYDLRGGGDERGVWGGKAAVRGQYTGDWVDNGSAVPDPADWDRYRRETQFSPSGREEDVTRYRNMGADLANVRAPQLQYGRVDQAFDEGQSHRQDANVARDQQRQALALTAGAAQGTAPSRAELLGRGLIDQSLKAQVAGAASARGGPLAQMAAQRGVQQGAAGFQAQGANQLSALRADEMERARAAYANQAGAIRSGDYQGQGLAYGKAGQYGALAQAETQNELEQRRMNQAGRFGYEQLGWDTNNAAMQAGLGQAGLEASAYEGAQNRRSAAADRDQRQGAAIMGSVSAGTGSLLDYAAKSKQQSNNQHSDMRAKKPLMLDLGGGRQPKAAAPNWLSRIMEPEQQQANDTRQDRQEHDTRLEQMDAPNIYRDDPYPDRTPGGITREDPYGSGEVFYSDENAKRAAFQDGVLYGESAGSKRPDALPAYMQPKLAGTSGPKPFERTGPKTAAAIDPNAHGQRRVPLPPGAAPLERGRDIGARAVERGREAPGLPPPPQPKPHDPSHPGGDEGPLAAVRQDANRRQVGFPYAYKDEYTPPEQQQGELNYGFSAQELERNPLTATAVRPDENGMRTVDMAKLVKVQGDGLASLQEQVDGLKYGGRRG